MASGYCPHCDQVVNVKREEFNVCLAIILAIFTGGIGLIIYLAIWYNKEEIRCAHCGSIIRPMEAEYKELKRQEEKQKNIRQVKSPYRITSSNNRKSKKEPDIITGSESKYCPFCGENVDLGTIFCPNCGSEIK